MTHNLQLDLEDEGPAIELHFSETGTSSPLLVYATSFGSIVGWDLREAVPRSAKEKGGKSPSFKLKSDLSSGVQTAMAISSDQVHSFGPPLV